MIMAPDSEAALVFLICMQITAVAFRLAGKKQYASWPLLLGTIPIFALAMAYILRSSNPAPNEFKWMAVEFAIFALAILSFTRFGRLCFWLAWMANSVLIGVVLYLLFFWHVFS